ncbi:putative lipid II flippase FtsW [Microbacterium sp. Leaf151]|uniref:putative lipid II flippase FtsW n=1 Tax=Microbacterium sp. Leaf151 TaxID=1736276 RepID=UPI0007000739|nr:putative lipid II flippase FtsW [Microbacterium sp. Leaf151]KQR20862.1 cell division protein FtsW [Microbacterium sp. Leaf151]
MTTTAPPPRQAPDDQPERGGLIARVSLGRAFRPVSTEFLLIASAALLLTGFGLVMVLSATSALDGGQSPFDHVMKQSVFAIVGIPLMFVLSRARMGFWQKIAWPALIFATAFQLLVYVPGVGIAANGNRNWVLIAGFQFQPAEFLKLALALWMGAVLYRKRRLLTSWAHVFIPVVPVSVLVIGTVLGGKDLGTVMILVLVVLGALFFAGIKLRMFIVPAVLSVAVVLLSAVGSENRMERIGSLFAPDDASCYYTTCYQSLHGVWGLASGGLFGLGLGNSKEKYDWLPAAANDYIFAIIGEELGLIGCFVVLVLFALFAVGAFRIIRRTDDTFVRIIAGAITLWIVGQALVNIGVVLRVFPVLGVPLPFMSQGGTSLLSVLIACGVLLSCARTLPDRRAVADEAPRSTSGRRPARRS